MSLRRLDGQQIPHQILRRFSDMIFLAINCHLVKKKTIHVYLSLFELFAKS